VAAGRRRSRRVSLPGVAELLRPAAAPGPDGGDERQASGREKHAQKITVYLTADELLDLERARLALRRFGVAVDRGRLVREAIAVLLADLDARGKESLLARRIGMRDEPSGDSANEPSRDSPNGTSGDAPNGTSGGNGVAPAASGAAWEGEAGTVSRRPQRQP